MPIPSAAPAQRINPLRMLLPWMPCRRLLIMIYNVVASMVVANEFASASPPTGNQPSFANQLEKRILKTTLRPMAMAPMMTGVFVSCWAKKARVSISMIECPTRPAANQINAQDVISVVVTVNSPRWNSMETVGSLKRINPTLAGRASRNMPRNAAGEGGTHFVYLSQCMLG